MTAPLPEPYRPAVGRLIGYVAAVLAALLVARSAAAAQVTLTSTVDQSGFNATTGAVNPLTATPWSFVGQQYGQLASIDSITVTLSVSDGNTGAGEFDEGAWTLGLDGLDTGLLLDGFDGGQIVTLTIAGPSNAAALLASLQSDGELAGSVIDATPGDNSVVFPSRVSASIEIVGTLLDSGGGGNPNGVPLPLAALAAPALGAVAVWRARRA
ncbi:MAG TPA: hypothetical protein VEA69_06820 [Tepidisphaeraceae bacterium]|nr:hypothetical protein [Tepidisphaeraceae bacterium]